LVEMSQYVQKLTPQPIFAYGGGAFLTGLPTADALLGSYLGTRIDGGVELLAQLAAASRGLGVRG
jgi:hypothetical protein